VKRRRERLPDVGLDGRREVGEGGGVEHRRDAGALGEAPDVFPSRRGGGKCRGISFASPPAMTVPKTAVPRVAPSERESWVTAVATPSSRRLVAFWTTSM
jgi:hypothetical protein